MYILAEAKEKVDALTYRALERVTHQEIRRQENIDTIVRGAVDYLPLEVSPVEVDSDWLVNFFNLGQDVSSAEMQSIWSKLLAGEVARPGSFKARTLQTVKSMSVEEANLFTALCGFSFVVGDDWALPMFSHEFFNFIRSNGLSTTEELHLKYIGLLSADVVYYGTFRSDGKIPLQYHSTQYLAHPEPADDFTVETDGELVEEMDVEMDGAYIKAFPFTETGMELVSIAGGKPNLKYIKVLRKDGCIEPLRTK